MCRITSRRAPALGGLVVLTLLGFFPTPQIATTHAQCQKWTSGPITKINPGTNGPVYTSIVWDPDGSGPRPELLVIGGAFTSVDGVGANNIAAWDGAVWTPMNIGVGGEVRALAILNGALVVGGAFHTAGGVPTTYVARWNDAYWSPMNNGMFGGTRVNALAIHNGQLYAGGDFDHYVRRWDAGSSTFVSLGSSLNATVHALVSHGGYLYAGGEFTDSPFTDGAKFARFNGSGWWGPDHGPDGTVYALAVLNGELYVGGNFNNIDQDYSLAYCVKWTGSGWDYLTCGLSCSPNATVRCITMQNSQVHVGGDFPTGGVNQLSRRVSRLIGSYWSQLGGGIGSPTLGSDAVHTLVVYKGELLAGGSFSSPTANLARWNGTSWANPAVPATVRALAVFGTRMAMGGAFQQYTSQGDTYHLTAWNGASLTRMGAGPNAPVNALLGYTENTNPVKHRLVVGGEFTNVDGLTASKVALWTESDNVFSSGWSTLGSGFNGDVLALARHYGQIVAGGGFSASGAASRNFVARWDGSAWQAMGTGMNGPVYALKAYQTNASTYVILAGGAFTQANGGTANSIASWVTSTVVAETPWSPLGAGFNGSVFAIERFGGSIYAGGVFTSSGATPLNRVARYQTGTGWVAVGTGFDAAVRSLWVDGGFLYAAGDFTGKVARWNGSVWSTVDGGANSSVMALASFHGEVMAGGSFTTVRATPVSATGVARYLATGIPWFVGFAWDQTTSEGADVVFRVEPVDGYAPLTYAWKKNGTPIVGGPTGQGSSIYINEKAITILNTAATDSGYYDCLVSSSCGGATGGGGRLTVSGTSGIGAPVPIAGLVLAASPNPFSRATQISFRLPERSAAAIHIYDPRGRLVRTYPPKTFDAGTQSVPFYGRDEAGLVLPAGVYFVRMEAGDLRAVQRIVLVR